MNTLRALRRGLRRAVLDRPAVRQAIERAWPHVRLLPLSARRQLDRQVLQRLPKDEARDMLLRRMPKDGVCVEIGVWKGDFSERILRITRPRLLHLVDPWMFQPTFPKRMYSGNLAASQADMDAIRAGVEQRFARNHEVRIHPRFSADLADIVGGDSLDWVYIDGNHSKAFVANDLELSWRCLRRGGYITGDDYIWRDPVDGACGVREAVDEFADRHRLDIELIGGQYLMRKP